MHSSVMAWVAEQVPRLGDLSELDVLEVGSHDVNGSVRPLFDGARSYLGIDPWPGPGVDRVVAVEHLAGSWGVVVSCEMLEHAREPEAAAQAIYDVTAPGGHLILTTRSEGFPHHAFPDDYGRRFSVAEIAILFDAFEPIELVPDPDPEAPGVFFHGRR